MKSKSMNKVIIGLCIALLVGTLVSFGLNHRTAHLVLAATPQNQPATRTVTGAVRDSYADVVDRVAPAVVTIRSARRIRAPQQFPFFDDPFFRQFFGNRNRNRSQQDRSLVERALGSGVIINADGHILTNHHVIDGADQDLGTKR